MPILSAQNSFKKGLAALIDDDPETATLHFREAVEIERQRHAARPTMRYLSYYGFCLARNDRRRGEAIHACLTAAKCEPRDPDLALNLGRVYMACGRYALAREAFDRGLRVSPDNHLLQRERADTERYLGAGSRRRHGSPAFRRFTGRVRKAIRFRAAAM